MKYLKKNFAKHGFSLVEILVVISIFAVLGILSTRSVFLTLRSSKKSESLVKVRESLNYAVSIIERQIRNSEVVVCPNTTPNVISYTSLEGFSTSFACVTSGTDKYIASGSARLTPTNVEISTCSLSCTQTDLNSPPVVTVTLEAKDNENQSVEKGVVSIQTKITARNY